MALINKLNAIGDAIRTKTGKTELLTLDQMPTEIESISGGGDSVIKTVEGTCPITLEDCAEGNLLDYKIYGAEGGVGDKTKNLCSGIFNTITRFDEPIPAGTILSFSAGTKGYDASSNNTKLRVRFVDSSNQSIWNFYPTLVEAENRLKSDNLTLTQDAYGYWLTNTDVGDYQIEIGATHTDYEPYGYKIPVKVNDDITKIYTKEPLGTGDYIDYENRLITINGVSTHTDLPELSLKNGTNTVDIDTTVKPSNVSLTYVKNIEFNTMKIVEGTLPLTVEGVGQRLEDYKIYGAHGDALYYGDANEYIGYDYITTNQDGGASNKAGFNSGIQWNQVNKFRFSIRNNTTQENNMIFAAKATNENVCSSLNSPWIGLGQVKYQSQVLTNLTSENHPDPGVFGIDTLKFTTPTSASYIWVASWVDYAWSRNNDWGFIEFYKDDTLVAAFYPAKRVSDGVFGFYNKVSGDFITCNASEGAFVGNTELSNAVGELTGDYYNIPVNINGNIINIKLTAWLGDNDYIDFENRALVKDGVSSYLDLPEIYLQNGQNIIGVDTKVKPSKMSVSFVDNVFDASHIITKSTEISCENTGTIYNSACEQVIKSPVITNPTGTYLYHWNQLNDNGYISKPTTQNGVTFTNAGNGKIVLSGTSTNRVLIPVASVNLMRTWDTSHKYYLRKLHSISALNTIYWHTYNKLIVSGIFLGSAMNFAANYPRVCIESGNDVTGIEITPQIFDLTAMFGEGNEPTMEQFDAMFPESYYPFNTGVDIYNMPITINGIVNDIVCADNGTGCIPKEKIIIPEGDVDISLQGTLSGTYLQTVSA